MTELDLRISELASLLNYPNNSHEEIEGALTLFANQIKLDILDIIKDIEKERYKK